jgi:hypothetical protein
MHFDTDQEFKYTLNPAAASIFGDPKADIEWNVTDEGVIRIESFINVHHHTPIMDHDMFYLSDPELYEEIVEYIKTFLPPVK